MTDLIYLDHHATTPCDPRVVEAMLPYFSESFSNPNSPHLPGSKAARKVEEAREQVADLIGASASEIAFTSGATESNNLAISGVALEHSGEHQQIITTAVEHKAVLEPCRSLERLGFEVIIVPVDGQGGVDLDQFEATIDENTLLVSVQAANNEIGTLQPVAKVSEIAHSKGILVHCDAAQAVGKVPVDVDALGVDLLSLSAHKLYGPKGVGALYIRGGPYSYPIHPLSLGGGQERQLRAGTLNVPGIVGLGKACELCNDPSIEESAYVSSLRDELEQKILRTVPDAWINGNQEHKVPGNSSLTLPGADAEAMIANMPDIAVSTGSACTVGTPEPSHVLTAIGLTREEASQTVRIGVGRFNQMKEIVHAVESISRAFERITGLSA